eukprot:TRINITY_DN19182_c0_g1_i1.p1 TRINITY_DN19182_c0_g1~~TRINITY_DN19182_c0_g1_i1.p1  ORF type:complete len:123 (-),score=9.88 TRINITY_DN19182_c0_g1_i1:41-409(-)
MLSPGPQQKLNIVLLLVLLLKLFSFAGFLWKGVCVHISPPVYDDNLSVNHLLTSTWRLLPLYPTASLPGDLSLWNVSFHNQLANICERERERVGLCKKDINKPRQNGAMGLNHEPVCQMVFL